MRFPYQTPQDRRPVLEAADQAKQIGQVIDTLLPCPAAGRSPQMSAKWAKAFPQARIR